VTEGVVSAALSGGAAATVADATGLLGQTDTALGEAATINQSAAHSAATAAQAANDVDAGIQTVIEQLSPFGPGCGCLP
jgi:hypothetical protein